MDGGFWTCRGEELGPSDDEVPLSDALETSDSAVTVPGDAALESIVRELVAMTKNIDLIDRAIPDNIRGHPRVLVKRILRECGYPPDTQEKATETVFPQA
jgi:type I restriction enzyme R subunit